MGQRRAQVEPGADSVEPRREVNFAADFAKAYRLLWVIAAGVTGDRAAAADIVHDAAVQALGRIQQFQPGTDFTAWMAQIVRYVALNHVRARRRRQALPLDGRNLQTDGRLGDPVSASARPILTEGGALPDDQPYFDDQLMGALQSLSETARACLLLRTVQDLSYAQIARVLEIPEGTAMSHVHRSRRQLRLQLRDRTAWAAQNKGRPA